MDLVLVLLMMLFTAVVHCHNEFLFAILAKCQITQSQQEPMAPTGASSRQSLSPAGSTELASKEVVSNGKRTVMPDDQLDTRASAKRGHQPSSTHFETVFSPISCAGFMQPADHLDYLRARQIQLCSQDLCLPDGVTLYGRIFLTAIDRGLDNIADEVPHLVALAVEDFIKNVVSAVVAHRKAYSLRDGRFRYSYSCDPPLKKWRKTCQTHITRETGVGPLQNGGKFPVRCHRVLHGTRQGEAAEILSAHGNEFGLRRGLITLGELRDTLQIDKQLVPSNAVFCTNMERLLAKMWHSGTSEQRHEKMYRRSLQRLAETRKSATISNSKC